MIVYTLNALRTYPVVVSAHYYPSADVLASTSNTLTTTSNTMLAQVLYGVFFEQNHTLMGENTLRKVSEPLCNKCNALAASIYTIFKCCKALFSINNTPLQKV